MSPQQENTPAPDTAAGNHPYTGSHPGPQPGWPPTQGATYPAPAWHQTGPVPPGALPYAPPLGCAVCGSQPVASVDIRAHQGLLFVMRFHTLDGPFCRSCGIALVRHMTTKTLWQGWWSPFSLLACAPFALLANLYASTRIKKLPPPVPPPGRMPLAEVTPVLRRPLAYVALIPILWAIALITDQI